MAAMYLNYTETVKAEAKVLGGKPLSSLKLMTFTTSTPVDGIEAPLLHIQGHGCDAAEYPDNANGKVILVERGECAFGQKAYAGGVVGASAVLIYNNDKGPLSGTLGQDFPEGAPTAGLSDEDGQYLLSLLQQGDVQVYAAIVELREERRTYNVIAQTKSGNPENVIVIGAHSDSVAAGPGINDNGSGTAALLELAHLVSRTEPNNAVRFCWWTAEEYGLLGAKHYVENLSEEERKKIALYLNFDMIASPNYYNGIYDGDGSDSAIKGPAGSGAIEKLFQDYFASKGESSDPSEFDGRSDYGPFIVGVSNPRQCDLKLNSIMLCRTWVFLPVVFLPALKSPRPKSKRRNMVARRVNLMMHAITSIVTTLTT